MDAFALTRGAERADGGGEGPGGAARRRFFILELAPETELEGRKAEVPGSDACELERTWIVPGVAVDESGVLRVEGRGLGKEGSCVLGPGVRGKGRVSGFSDPEGASSGFSGDTPWT